jgi:hypothetical protein
MENTVEGPLQGYQKVSVAYPYKGNSRVAGMPWDAQASAINTDLFSCLTRKQNSTCSCCGHDLEKSLSR